MRAKLLPPAGLTALGAAGLFHMVKVEGEPGALPLLLVLAGSCWAAIVLYRSRR